MISGENGSEVTFTVDEVVEIKGWLFKITTIDAFTNKLCMKRVSQIEATELRKKHESGV
jgi:hypothetical protein